MNNNKNNSIPIIFIHKGSPLYLKIALKQALKNNSNVFLLGDESNNFDFIQHYNINDYDDSKQFDQVYFHMSPNNMSYEFFCLQRWFILRNFCITNKIDKCWICDSDVLLYGNMNELTPYIENKDFSVLRKNGYFVGPQTSFFTTNCLIEFCSFIITTYTEKLSDLKQIYHKLIESHNISGISDMVLLALYSDTNANYIDFDYSVERNFLFDENISCPAGFLYKKGKKVIRKNNNKPYSTYLKTGEEKRFFMLHFQGSAKELIIKYCSLSIIEKLKTKGYIFFIYKRTLQNLNILISKLIPKVLKKKIKSLLCQ